MTLATKLRAESISKAFAERLKRVTAKGALSPDDKNNLMSTISAEVEIAFFGPSVGYVKEGFINRLESCESVEDISSLQLLVYAKFGINNRFSIRFDHQCLLLARRIKKGLMKIKPDSVQQDIQCRECQEKDLLIQRIERNLEMECDKSGFYWAELQSLSQDYNKLLDEVDKLKATLSHQNIDQK